MLWPPTDSERRTTVSELLAAGEQSVSLNERELVLAFVLGKSRCFVIAHPEYVVSDPQAEKYRHFVRRLSDGFPLAYLTGRKEFYRLKLQVDENTLIPRPETEILVETAGELLRQEKFDLLADIGTGSGAIIIALAKFFLTNKETVLLASDRSERVEKIFRLNVKNHLSCPVEFFRGHLLEPLREKLSDPTIQNILLAANLPYVDTQRKKDLLARPESRALRYEPPQALWAGESGLALYREFFEQIAVFLPDKNVSSVCEIDPSQEETFIKTVRKIFPRAETSVHTDLSGRSRVVVVRIGPSRGRKYR